MNSLAIRARYLFPVDQPPIPDGILTIADGRIAALGENASGREPLDLGNVALLPGLVNAHTHLEFNDLTKPLGPVGSSMTEWIARVIDFRQSRTLDRLDEAQHLLKAVSGGLIECQNYGTTTLGEIARPGWPMDSFRFSPIDCTVFLELLGLGADRIDPLMELAREHLELGLDASTDWRPGLSPHAPYTVHPELLDQVCRLSREKHVPVAFHLAESAEELDLLATGGGPFVDLLESLDAWHLGMLRVGSEPLDYLKVLAQADRALVIHGTYLSAEEIDFLAGCADHMSVVYCPRTHAHFGHRPYPLSEMLARGANVALGTDSRASNPDLSVLAEMRYVHRHHSDVPPADVLRLGTINGAKALGLQDAQGSLAIGKLADFVAVGLPDSDEGDPFELLLTSHFPTQRLCFAHRQDMKTSYRRRS